MFLLGFYRFYISVACGGAVYFIWLHRWWAWLLTAILTRIVWFIIEMLTTRAQINRQFQNHASTFKQLYGPYGIRIINKAETDWSIKKSLSEVFTSNTTHLKKSVEQLEVMDTLFQAGIRPEGDEWLLHDLKLKYGKQRLTK